jgi:hypothetical protein
MERTTRHCLQRLRVRYCETSSLLIWLTLPMPHLLAQPISLSVLHILHPPEKLAAQPTGVMIGIDHPASFFQAGSILGMGLFVSIGWRRLSQDVPHPCDSCLVEEHVLKSAWLL